MHLHCKGLDILTSRYCADCNPPPDAFSHPNNVRPNEECKPLDADGYAAFGSTCEDDPCPELMAVLASSRIPRPDIHETTVQDPAILGPHHEESSPQHKAQCDFEDISVLTTLQVDNVCTGKVNAFGSFTEFQCPWCPEGGCAVRIRRWLERWDFDINTNIFIKVPFLTCDVHAHDFCMINSACWQQLMYLRQEKKARISPDLVSISIGVLPTRLVPKLILIYQYQLIYQLILYQHDISS
jgi:hypothetical protein